MKLPGLFDDHTSDEPNITPLIDIVFILLIFFVVTTTFAQDLGLEIDRPDASTGVELPSRVIRIAVDRGGSLTIDAQPIRLSQVEAELRDRFELFTDRNVLVVADQSVEAVDLVAIMDAARTAGARGLSLAVEESQ